MIDDDLFAEEAPEEELTPFGHRLKAALEMAISTMLKEGLLEVNTDHIEALVLEATHAGVDANSPKHLVKKVRGVLLDSEFVDEVYATDDTIDDVLRRSLGG